MNIRIAAVGKVKEKFFKAGIDEYKKRLSRYCKLAIYEVPDEKAPETMSEAEVENVKRKEAERLMRVIREDSCKIILAIEGKDFSSEEFATHLDKLQITGKSNVDIVIGGSLGLHKIILDKADLKLSFSRFTFPHQLMRVILLEQIYRAFRIIRGEPYHK